MSHLVQDLRYGLRMLRRYPGLALTAVSTLGLGIGANCTVFSVFNGALLKGLPFEDSHRIAHLSCSAPARGEQSLGLSYPDFLDWQAQSRSFDEMAACATETMNLSEESLAPERVAGARVSPSIFPLLRVRPVLGRTFTAAECLPAAEPVAVVGYAVWQARYGSDPGVLGRRIRINGGAATIIGVMPQGMKFPYGENLWLPLLPGGQHDRRDQRPLTVVGRLRDGVSMAAAQAELSAVSSALEKQYPITNEGVRAKVQSWNRAVTGPGARNLLALMLGAVGFVLLIVCANIGNLLLARSAERAREVSTRLALGAGRWTLVRQLMSESLLIGLAGGVVGLGVAIAGTRAFSRLLAVPYWIDFSMDARAFAFLFAVSLVAVVLFGLAPALQSLKVDIVGVLKEGGRCGDVRARRISAVLVTAQLALSVILLAGAGLMMRTFLELQRVNMGVRVDGLLTMRVTLPEAQYPDEERLIRFYGQLGRRLVSATGIESVSLMSHIPGGWSSRRSFEPAGLSVPPDSPLPSASALVVDERYFRTMGVRLLRGRDFTEFDGRGGSVPVIVNEVLAARHWPREDPVGKRIRLMREKEVSWAEVVGVCPAILQNALGAHEPDPILYIPLRAEPPRTFAVAVRSDMSAQSAADALRAVVRGLDRDLPVYDVVVLRDFLEHNQWPFRVFGTVFGLFGIAALGLSATGVYGLTAHVVSRRTREIGLRMALGARTADVLRFVVSGTVRCLGAGLALGLLGATHVSVPLGMFMIRISPSDPTTFVSTAALLVLVALLACLIPAWRAVRLNPVEALHME